METDSKRRAKKSTQITTENKLEFLNFNLKNEIFAFLPVTHVIENLQTCKKFAFAVKNIRYIKNLSENFSELIKESNFTEEIMLPIIERFEKLAESKGWAYEIANYLLIRKIRDYEEFKVVEKINFHEALLNILADAIRINRRIKFLSFNDCPIEAKFSITQKIHDILIINKYITNLDISNNGLGVEQKNFEILKEMLTNNKTLKNLLIQSNKIGANAENIKLLVEG